MQKRHYKKNLKNRSYLNAFPCNNKKYEDNTNGTCTRFNLTITCMGDCAVFQKLKKTQIEKSFIIKKGKRLTSHH